LTIQAECQWLTPVILATQEAEIRANSSVRSYLEKPFTKIGLVEWLKVKVLSASNIHTQKKLTTKINNTTVNHILKNQKKKKKVCLMIKLACNFKMHSTLVQATMTF
jgi:hypothetical protein